jgi:hypothetical protein
MEDHIENCRCEVCQFGKDFVDAKEARFMQEFGWYAHMVLDDSDCPNNTNFHTHGIEEKFGHPDFQICIQLHPNLVMGFFHLLVDKIKQGETFGPGKVYEDLTDGYPTQFLFAKEGGRILLRMIVCNAQKTYEGDIYEAQFTKLEL